MFRLIIPFLGVLFTQAVLAGQFTPYVDTRIGTAPNPTATAGVAGEIAGNVQPTAVTPFGMVQFGPDTGKGSPGGYQYSDTQINGFSLTHLSGPGCTNSGEVSIIPLSGEPLSFSHVKEQAKPGYYSVELDDGIQVELTSTIRSGFARLTYPGKTTPAVAIDFMRTGTGSHNGRFQKEDDQHFSGWVEGGNFCGPGNHYKVYFVIEFDQPVQYFNVVGGDTAQIEFDPNKVSVIQMKVGISYVSTQNAAKNLAAENATWDFSNVVNEADLAWDQALGKIQVEGGSDPQKTTFYTALFHALLHPNIFSDVDGSYIGFDRKVHNVSENPGQQAQYANFSGWDIYRSEIQLLSFLAPSMTSDIIQSLVNDGDQCGALPKWANNNDETGIMVGDPGPLVVANAYAFGAQKFHLDHALSLMKKSGSSPGTKCNGYEARPYLNLYLKYGFVPRNTGLFWDTHHTASITLEYVSSDFAISQFAKNLGDQATYQEFFTQSSSWQNLFDDQTTSIRPRYKNLSWMGSFDLNSTEGFTEGNSAQYSWMIPFDVQNLIEKMGGAEVTQNRLDSFFTQLNAWEDSAHFWMGNEPGFNSPWIYNWLGKPELTQNVISRILAETFNSGPGGLPGNDDLGATSSWYVWSALGLYPAIPGVGGFVLSKPSFPQTTIRFENGHTLTIDADHLAGNIQWMNWNGIPQTRSWIDWSELRDGGAIQMGLSASSSAWATGTSDLPPSYRDF